MMSPTMWDGHHNLSCAESIIILSETDNIVTGSKLYRIGLDWLAKMIYFNWDKDSAMLITTEIYCLTIQYYWGRSFTPCWWPHCDFEMKNSNQSTVPLLGIYLYIWDFGVINIYTISHFSISLQRLFLVLCEERRKSPCAWICMLL